ncbi:MAG: hypothetical protein MI810_18215 [Flavobacteriales bacterium]|nr:hypothetical protein [Flavobacteriales bacterium]
MPKEDKVVEGTAQHQLIVGEAQKRGFEVEEKACSEGKRLTILKKGNHQEKIYSGIPESWVNDNTAEICDQKQLTKQLFQEIEIPTPISFRFQLAEDLDEEVFRTGKNYICKPEVGTNGKGVEFDIKNLDLVKGYLQRNSAIADTFLLEEFVSGEDLRLQIIGRKIVAACVRKPASVIGDGQYTLSKLIEKRQAEVQAQNPANRLEIDEQSKELIRLSNYSFADVIPENTEIRLKKIANMGQGAKAIDVTDEIDPALQHWVNRISTALQAPYFALDIISNDPSNEKECVALELNLRAEWMHHTFSEKRTHDLAKTVIDELFGPEK